MAVSVAETTPTTADARAKRGFLRTLGLLGPAIAMLWAGVAFAGNVIAAGSKFTTELARTDLLEVGIVQFAWVGATEWVIAAVFVLASVARWRSRVVWLLAVPVVIFAVQQWGVHPLLHERTLATIAGEELGDSPLHVVYAALEGVKLIVLVVIGVLGTLVHRGR